MIRITLALNWWSRISFIIVSVGRRGGKHRCFNRSGGLNEHHQATLWLNSFSLSVVVSERPRNTSPSESASLGLVASTHPRVMSKPAYFICENASWESRQCQRMLEINLRALTNVNAKLEEAWAGVCSGAAEIAKAVLCQLNNGVFRLGTGWVSGWGGDAVQKWQFVAQCSSFWPLQFWPKSGKPRTFPSSISCKKVWGAVCWYSSLFRYSQCSINIYLFMTHRHSSSWVAHVLLVHRWEWAEGLVIGRDCVAHWTSRGGTAENIVILWSFNSMYTL